MGWYVKMNKEKENMIVKYGNNLNNFNYGRFTAVEADIFFSLVAKIKNTDGKLVMSFDELKNLSNYYSRDMKRFVGDVENTFTKYLNLKYKEDDGNILKITNVFQKLEVNREEKEVFVHVTPGMEDVILSVSENFTRFELSEFTHLRGSYSKSIYRLLKQYRHTGIMNISIEDLRFKLDIPKSYAVKDIDKVVLSKSIEELSAYFPKLMVKKEYKKSSSGRGRPAVAGYIFTFVPEERYRDKKEEQKKAKIKKIPYPCPRCGGELIERKMNGKIAFCHADGHEDGAVCSAVFNSLDELIPSSDDRNLSSDEQLTEEQHENKKKISDLLKGIFG